jgi:hypothetical protein
MPFSPSQRVTIPEHVLFQELDDEAVVVSLNDATCFSLNEVGTRMWLALTGADSIEAAYEILLTEYEVDPERLRQDMIHLVEELLALGLITVQVG